ncbi:MAG: LolA family protein [Stackebrandtia sp.]
MSRKKSLRRYGVPIAVGAGALLIATGTGIFMAGADDDLPERTAEDLFEAVQNADVEGYVGTIEQTSDLGMPDLGLDSANPASLSPGSHEFGVWSDSSGNMRASAEGDLAESSIVVNDSDMWAFNKELGLAGHSVLPEDLAGLPASPLSPLSALAGFSGDPAQTADSVLSVVEDVDDLELTTDGVETIAGRDAYGLLIEPKAEDVLVDAMRLVVDAETGLPLQTQLFSQGKETPAFENVFKNLELEVPDADVFEFEPPEGVEVVEGAVSEVLGTLQGVALGGDATAIGSGLETISVSELDQQELLDQLAALGVDTSAVDDALSTLEPVSGDWGSGKLLQTDLFNVLLSDDGVIAAGAVSPEMLYEVV